MPMMIMPVMTRSVRDKRAAVHDHGAQAFRHAGHFADHDQDPGKAGAEPQAVEDARQRRRQHHGAKHLRAGAAEHFGGFEQAGVDRLHAEHGVQQDRIERAEKDQEDRRLRAEPEKDHRQRQPGSHRHRPQQRQHRVEQGAQQRDAAEHQPERNAGRGRQKEAAIDALHRLPEMNRQAGAIGVVVDAAEGKVPHHDGDAGRRRDEPRAGPAHHEVPQEQQA